MRSLTGTNRVRPRPDQRVDRPEVEAPQGVQLTGTNRPRTYPTHHTTTSVRVHCAVLNPHTSPTPPTGGGAGRLIDRFTALRRPWREGNARQHSEPGS